MNYTMQPNRIQRYGNAIEPLVIQEVERQMQQLPPQLVKYLDPAQAIAYALNRLPALYATSVEGWHRQQQVAKEKMGDRIEIAVRQGLAALQRDPLKASTPLSLLAIVDLLDITECDTRETHHYYFEES